MTGKVRPRSGTSRRRWRRWFLPLVAALFALSAMLRLGDGLGVALAAVGERASQPADCAIGPGMDELLQAMQERERQLTEREGLLADRKQALDLADSRIQERLASLVAAESRLARTVAIADRAADDDVAKLVTVYENMKPKQAAPLFAAMAPDFAAGFLGRMRPDAAAAILSSIDPDIAYSISAILAGRNAGAPEN